MRVDSLSEDLTGYHQIAAACDRLYPRLHAALAERGIPFDGRSLALYEDRR